MGFLLSDKLSKRVNDLTILKKALTYIKTLIRYNSGDIKDILEATDARFKDDGFKLFSLIKAEMDNGQSIEGGFNEVLDSNNHGLRLTNKDLDILRSLSKELGSSDVEGQLSTLEQHINQLEDYIQEATQIHKTKGKLYRNLGVVTGAFAAVLMI